MICPLSKSKKYGGYGLILKACHGLQSAIKDDKINLYFEGGQICFSDEGNFDTVCEWAESKIQKELSRGAVFGKTLTQVDIAQVDGITVCSCRKCREFNKEEDSSAATMIDFANRVAENFEESAPGVRFSVLLYCFTIKPPKTVIPHKNLHLSYCFYLDNAYGTRVCMNHPFDGTQCTTHREAEKDFITNVYFAEMFEKWATYGCWMDVWYYGEFYYTAVPTPDLMLHYDNVRYLRDHGVKGWYGGQGGDEDYLELESYLQLKLMWDCDITREEYLDLIREIFVINYGEVAGEDMYEYFLLWDKSGRDMGCGVSLKGEVDKKVDFAFYASHYEEMIHLFEEAMEYAPTFHAYDSVEELSLHMDFVGLSGRWKNWYENGTDEEKAFICDRYKTFYDRAVKYDMKLNVVNADIWPNEFSHFPKEGMDFTKSPVEYFQPMK